MGVQVCGGEGDFEVVSVDVFKGGEGFVIDFGEGFEGFGERGVGVVVVEADFEGAAEGVSVVGCDGDEGATFAPEDDPDFTIGWEEVLGAVEIVRVGDIGGIGRRVVRWVNKVVQGFKEVGMDVVVGHGSGLDVGVHDYMSGGHAAFVDVEEGRIDGDDFRVVGKVELEEGRIVGEFMWEVADEFDGVLWLVVVDG